MSSDTKKKSPNLDLRGEKGNYVIGVFKRRFENKTYPGVFSSLIEVKDTNGTTTLWDGEKNTDVNIVEGDTVFLKETRWLNKFFSELKEGDSIKVTYIGKGKATKKGFKAPYMYNTEVL